MVTVNEIDGPTPLYQSKDWHYSMVRVSKTMIIISPPALVYDTYRNYQPLNFKIADIMNHAKTEFYTDSDEVLIEQLW